MLEHIDMLEHMSTDELISSRQELWRVGGCMAGQGVGVRSSGCTCAAGANASVGAQASVRTSAGGANARSAGARTSVSTSAGVANASREYGGADICEHPAERRRSKCQD
jgi:hypothetical protein